LTAPLFLGQRVAVIIIQSMRFLRFSIWVLLLIAPFALHAQREKFPMEDLELITKQWPALERTATGLRTLVLSPGTGATPKVGDNVVVRYKGAFLDGKVFDQNLNRDPFTFHVGRREVIEGWDEGLQLMKVGEKRLLVVPSELAYGARGRPPNIPRSATLVFEVELLEIKPPLVSVGGK
jgi:FKBP-type peptidyl-prolyl cis-trans isomerase